ncbi:MAG: hypothetical protein DI628_06055 [Blastochloris viridis]|uniref:Peptidylprolyl isomerase n=1 Tax=Blastochloris viridis TaxID=1079 RepID=A0A6N4R806_BLAVI|nr:MAG: hypothetical protein DI628_06055 [Blastochloris viridis]
MLGRMGLMAVALVLAACSGNGYTYKAHAKPALPKPFVEMVFQEGQKVRVQMLGQDAELENAFMSWVEQGVYTNAPVYRQLPGVFVLAGKPRLKGEGFVMGTAPAPQVDAKGQPMAPKVHEAGVGHLGLVVHADGTVGPEMILIYGKSVGACCEAPKNVRIGAIREGRLILESVKRGDNLLGVARTL